MSTIKQWLQEHNYRLEESRTNEQGFTGPNGEFLLLNSGDDSEKPFWNWFSPANAGGEHPDQSGAWNEIPNG